MGKSRTKVYESPRIIARKRMERMLRDDEVYSEPELKDRKRRIAAAIRRRDQQAHAEDVEKYARGFCSTCSMLLTTTGECGNVFCPIDSR